MFGGAGTLAWVSGEALRSQAPRSGVLLGVDGGYRWDRHVRRQVPDSMPTIGRYWPAA